MDEIKVHVVNKGRKYLYMRYLCPLTGRETTKSTGTNDADTATKAAGKWEAELREGRYQKPSKMTWEAFREYYTTHAMPAVAPRSAEAYESTLNVFETHCTPQKLADVTTTRVTGFVAAMRKLGRSEATIACRLRHLKAAMRWANSQGLLRVLPKFDMPKRTARPSVSTHRPTIYVGHSVNAGRGVSCRPSCGS